ncbi:hypothetical protein X943_003985 [Babesia divergens]|uniref:Uncharacterized protein n=1 Tax=Babesia divergens TaxID=32595 RepID=A0AAD9G826_BABDI|nr:hypothetical protein X943_003985 [Babesia divergens]
MMYPGMMQAEPQPPISANVRMYLRVVGFVVVASAIYFYGDFIEMPDMAPYM